MRLPVYINETKDQELYNFFKSLPNFSNWVRECARKEIESRKQKSKQDQLIDNLALSDLIERMIESRLNGRILVDTKPETERVEVEGVNIEGIDIGNIEEDILDSIEDYM